MTKDTGKIIEELGLCPDFKTFYDENKDNMISSSLSEMLDRLMKSKGLKKSAVIKASELSEVYAYQIFSGRRNPERNKLLCLSVGMGLDLGECQELLRAAGYQPLYVKLPFDSIVIYGICKKMTVMQINGMLFDYGHGTL